MRDRTRLICLINEVTWLVSKKICWYWIPKRQNQECTVPSCFNRWRIQDSLLEETSISVLLTNPSFRSRVTECCTAFFKFATVSFWSQMARSSTKIPVFIWGKCRCIWEVHAAQEKDNPEEDREWASKELRRHTHQSPNSVWGKLSACFVTTALWRGGSARTTRKKQTQRNSMNALRNLKLPDHLSFLFPLIPILVDLITQLNPASAVAPENLALQVQTKWEKLWL